MARAKKNGKQDTAKSKKKSSCMGFVLKLLLYFIAFIVVASFFVKDSDDKVETNIVSQATQAQVVTTEPVETPMPTAGNETQPSITGSQVYDIVISLESKGIPKAKTQISKDVAGHTIYQHASSGMDDSAMISYNITSDQNHSISYAVFNVSNDEAPWYLPFCASMPYEKSEPEKASAFVTENEKTEASIQIGDAIFAIFPNDDGGAMLTITAVGYEEWCLAQLAE